jgi:hypothetical protein
MLFVQISIELAVRKTIGRFFLHIVVLTVGNYFLHLFLFLHTRWFLVLANCSSDSG